MSALLWWGLGVVTPPLAIVVVGVLASAREKFQYQSAPTRADFECPDLLPCPFCGGAADLVVWDEPEYPKYYPWMQIECGECEASVDRTKDPEHAAELWNRRAGATANHALPTNSGPNPGDTP